MRQSKKSLIVISLCRCEKASPCTKHYKEIEANDSSVLRPKAGKKSGTWKYLETSPIMTEETGRQDYFCNCNFQDRFPFA